MLVFRKNVIMLLKDGRGFSNLVLYPIVVYTSRHDFVLLLVNGSK